MTEALDAVQQEQLYVEYYPKVFAYISYRVDNHSDAEDLASTVFLKVIKNFSRFDSEKSSVSTWIYSITRNTVIDYFRKNRVDSPLSDEMISSENVEESVLREELLDKLAASLEKMDRRERNIIVLHYYHRKPLSEIASVMNISYSYIKVLHKKAVAQLREGIQ